MDKFLATTDLYLPTIMIDDNRIKEAVRWFWRLDITKTIFGGWFGGPGSVG